MRGAVQPWGGLSYDFTSDFAVGPPIGAKYQEVLAENLQPSVGGIRAHSVRSRGERDLLLC